MARGPHRPISRSIAESGEVALQSSHYGVRRRGGAADWEYGNASAKARGLAPEEAAPPGALARGVRGG